MVGHGRGTALIFARTDTAHFARFVWDAADALLFLRGRLEFRTVTGELRKDAGAPSVLCAYGRRDAEILAASGLAGQIVPLRLPRFFALGMVSETWQALVIAVMPADGPVSIAALYAAVATHPKARRNRDVRAKVRQVLQEGPFERVDRGLWRKT